MNKAQFIKYTKLIENTEEGKFVILLLYLLYVKKKEKVTFDEVFNLYIEFDFKKPNKSRLRKNIIKNRKVVCHKDSFRIHASALNEFKSLLPQIFSNEVIIVTDYILLPSELYENTRGYIKKLGDQINSTYESKAYDGCAVLMRRLLEILLVMSYIYLGYEDEIKDVDGYFIGLSKIIKKTEKSNVININGKTVKSLDPFRELGNFAAHKIEYNTRKSEIDKVAKNYRVTIEELLYKAGVLY